MLSLAQHGFRPGRSCETALLTVVHRISDSLDSAVPCKLVQLDFTKAFDKVDHTLLRKKLVRAGFQDQILVWLSDFIFSRQQRVYHNGTPSQPQSVISGIPQGSVLVPTLFSLFINDLIPHISSTPVLYADDLTLVKPIKSTKDYDDLQQDLDRVHIWTTVNKLPLSASKSKSVYFTTQRKVPCPLPLLRMNDEVINRSDNIKILGVTLDTRLTFSNHVHFIASRSRRLLGFIQNISRGLGPMVMAKLYTALVLPILEYCSPIWSPRSTSTQDILERIQRKSAYGVYARSSPIPGLQPRDISTSQLLRTSGWTSLATRRDMATLRLLATQG